MKATVDRAAMTATVVGDRVDEWLYHVRPTRSLRVFAVECRDLRTSATERLGTFGASNLSDEPWAEPEVLNVELAREVLLAIARTWFAPPSDAERIRALEAERDELQADGARLRRRLAAAYGAHGALYDRAHARGGRCCFCGNDPVHDNQGCARSCPLTTLHRALSGEIAPPGELPGEAPR